MSVPYFGSPVFGHRIRNRNVTKKTSALWARIIGDAEDEKPTAEERRQWHNPLCGDCGHFTSWESDNYTNFGGPEDTDPPDPIYQCDRCVAKEIGDAMTARRMWSHWRTANWENLVAPLIGFGKAGSPGAAWSQWCDSSKPLPRDWVWRPGWPKTGPLSDGLGPREATK